MLSITAVLLFLAKAFLIRLLHGKKKCVKGNYSLFMNKALSKAIMVRRKLRNTFLKNRSEENKKNYKNCASLLQKSKRDYYNNLNEKNKKFWKVVKPLLSNKIVSNEKIALVEGKKLLKSIKQMQKC